jgi:hypothetical protein
MCLFCVCVVLCLGRGLATSLTVCKIIMKLKIRGQGPRGLQSQWKKSLPNIVICMRKLRAIKNKEVNSIQDLRTIAVPVSIQGSDTWTERGAGTCGYHVTPYQHRAMVSGHTKRVKRAPRKLEEGVTLLSGRSSIRIPTVTSTNLRFVAVFLSPSKETPEYLLTLDRSSFLLQHLQLIIIIISSSSSNYSTLYDYTCIIGVFDRVGK